MNDRLLNFGQMSRQFAGAFHWRPVPAIPRGEKTPQNAELLSPFSSAICGAFAFRSQWLVGGAVTREALDRGHEITILSRPTCAN
jgi:hypothetical protein